MLGRHQPFCDKVASRYRAKLGLQRARDISHRGLNLVDDRGPLALEPLFHVLRCLCNQLLENPSRDVPAEAELLGEDGIAFSALDHAQKAEVRKAHPGIACNRIHDVLIAARHQHVGDGFSRGLSL
jgi:hypothetical protein